MVLGKNLPQKRAGRVAQVVECLPGKCEALNSNLSALFDISWELGLGSAQIFHYFGSSHSWTCTWFVCQNGCHSTVSIGFGSTGQFICK
jgi:hypothetical protein